MILIDGDIVAYRCAFKCNDESVKTACYTTGSFLSDMISDLYTQIDSEPDYRVYLTGKGNYRNDVAVTAPYKGNRKDKKSPYTWKLYASILSKTGMLSCQTVRKLMT